MRVDFYAVTYAIGPLGGVDSDGYIVTIRARRGSVYCLHCSQGREVFTGESLGPIGPLLPRQKARIATGPSDFCNNINGGYMVNSSVASIAASPGACGWSERASTALRFASR